jgi:hypothetical protein
MNLVAFATTFKGPLTRFSNLVSLADNAWEEVRKHYEPGAYERADDASTASTASDFQDLKDLPDPEEFPVAALPPTTRQFVREAAAEVLRAVRHVRRVLCARTPRTRAGAPRRLGRGWGEKGWLSR